MQRREILNALAVAGATVPAAMLSEAAEPSSRATPSATRTTVAPFIEAHDGTRLYWTQWGGGRPILFLNSWGLTMQMWDYQMVAFADQGYRCITFDRRGHGRSDVALGGYDYDTFADDVAAVISALKLQDLTGWAFDGERRDRTLFDTLRERARGPHRSGRANDALSGANG